MKIAVKYGALITLGIIAWVVIAHLLVPNPCSSVHVIGPIVFFNLLEIIGVYVGMGARKRESLGELSFKDGLKTGMGIALAYGVSSCIFFLLFITVVGRKAMCPQPGLENFAFWQIAAFAFVGQFLGAIFLGVIYSTISAFVLATRRKG